MLFLLSTDYNAKELLRNADKRTFLALALVAVLAARVPLIAWLAPAILLLGAVLGKDGKPAFDKRSNRIFIAALVFDALLAFNIEVLTAPLFVLLLPLPLILMRKKNAVRK